MAEQSRLALTNIRSAGNGEAALQLIQEEPPGVVLTDIRMPRMDGIELCRRIREAYGSIRIAVISGYGDFAYAQQCMSLGVKHYLLKPVTRPDVEELLQSLWEEGGGGTLSLSEGVAWVEQLEEFIWMLRRDDMEQWLNEGEARFFHRQLALDEMKRALPDCGVLLLKRLRSRGHAPSVQASDYREVKGRAEAYRQFRRFVQELADELDRMRSGSFRHPWEEAKHYIDEHLSEEITLEEVAERVGLAPTYFSSLFKRMTSESFIQYRIKKRIEKAKDLLALPHMRIVDIAAAVGYEDYPHFTKTFKKMTGMSPTEFRHRWGLHDPEQAGGQAVCLLFHRHYAVACFRRSGDLLLLQQGAGCADSGSYVADYQ